MKTVAATTIIVGLTIFMSWPQALHMATQAAAHQDTYFSLWRLAWVAHAIRDGVGGLFDANILHPATGTLAYSDATLLEGVLGAPFFWANVPPILTYNILLLGGIAASGVAMFVLARHLTGAFGPALVAAAIFTMAPYRIEHFMHLELQWAMWVPLTLWALHRAVEEGSRRFGLLSGLFLWLQILSCVYYGVFLAIAVAAFVPLLLLADRRRAVAAIPALGLGALVAVILTLPYAAPYLENARTLGARDLAEIARYSARPVNYLASSPQNWLWGWTASRWGGAELSLFPGAAAIALAAVALAYRPRRLVITYAALAAMCVELSFGLNGRLYSWLFGQISALHGFRSPSRFSIIAFCAIAALAGFGVAALQQRLRTTRRGWAPTTAALSLILVVVDFANTGMHLAVIAHEPRDVYELLRSRGPGVVVELPMPAPEALPGFEAQYAFWSTSHWNPLVNGYSGYYTEGYIATLHRMRRFPDGPSIDHLERLGVRYIVVHRAFYGPEEYSALLVRMGGRLDLEPLGTSKDPLGEARLFEIRRP